MSIRYEDYEADEGLREDHDLGTPDREISLGTATVLGIFLGLALVCALFFAFGYSMGRRSVPSALANVNTGISSPLPENRLTPGTLPGSPADASPYVPPVEHASTTSDAASGAHAPAGQHTKPPASAAVSRDASTAAAVESAEREQVARAVEQATTAAPRSVAAALPSAAAPVAGGSFVQITAISPTHRADADMLINSLRRKGYAAAIHTGSADGLLHVQLGPFANRKEAEAMRQRLSTDGYNSILK